MWGRLKTCGLIGNQIGNRPSFFREFSEVFPWSCSSKSELTQCRICSYNFGVILTLGMIRFEWDPVKAWTNQRKHGVNFEDAMHVFEDSCALLEQDRTGEAGELRWQALGLAGGVTVLLVAHTVREEGEDEVIRLISARQATRKERKRYEQTRAQDVG
jgi:uncharacterized protein